MCCQFYSVIYVRFTGTKSERDLPGGVFKGEDIGLDGQE